MNRSLEDLTNFKKLLKLINIVILFGKLFQSSQVLLKRYKISHICLKLKALIWLSSVILELGF